MKKLIYTPNSSILCVDSIEKAYTLGFIWGDGSFGVYKHTDIIYPRFEIQRGDFEVLLPLFTCWGKWSIHYRKRPNRKEQGTATLCDTNVGWFLKDHSYLQKSHIAPTKILSVIPINLQPYWWRGYLDADGCFYSHDKQYIKQFSLAGTYEQDWSEAESLLQTLGAKYKICRRSHRNKAKTSYSSIVLISKLSEIKKLGDFVYDGNTCIGLSRKYSKYISLFH